MASSGASRAASVRNTASAVGERQMLPRQTNRILIPVLAGVSRIHSRSGRCCRIGEYAHSSLHPAISGTATATDCTCASAGRAGAPGRFNEQVRRNRSRFPADFMFQLTAEESRSLRSQFATLKSGRGQHRKYRPYAFTEQGVAMLSAVLRSARAIAVNIQIMRAFVRMRELLISNRELAEKLDQLEARLEKKLASHDEAITRSGPSPMAAIGCLNHEDFWRQSARNATARAYERKS